jgi:hypothetical protein
MQKKSNKAAQPGVPSGSEIVLCQTEDKQTRIEVRLEGNAVGLTEAQMSASVSRRRFLR